MNDKWRKKDYYPSLLFFLLSMSALCFYVYKCDLKIVSPVLCCMVLPVCLLYHLAKNSKKQWLLITILISIILLIMEIGKGDKQSSFDNYYNYFMKFTKMQSEDTTFSYGEVAVTFLILFIIFILVSDVLMLSFRIRLTVLAMLLLMISYSVIFHDFLNKSTLAFSFTYCLMIILEGIQILEDKEEGREGINRKRTQAVFFFVPFILTFTLIILCLPKYDKPYQWTFAKSAINFCVQETRNVYQRVTAIVDSLSDGTDIQKSGYSEKGFLGTGFLQNKEVVMQLERKKGDMKSLYLSGKYFSDFKDMEWTAKKETKDLRALSIIPNNEEEEFNYALGRYGIENRSFYFYYGKCQITFKKIYTKTIFHPIMTTRISNEADKTFRYKGRYNQLLYRRNHGYGTKYIFDCKEVDLTDDAVIQMIREECNYQYTNKTRFEKTLRNRADIIRSVYGTKPDFSPEVKDYIEQVISPYDNDYDKLKAIEEMLSTYHYTTNPVELDREHFMDDFLLDKKEGYCTYFATAFTLISRYLGLPARYVQGYVVTFDGKTADVLKENAHAWPEVYFEGVGWVPFEPTPTFYNERYLSHSKGIQKGTTNNYYQSYYGNNQNIQEPNLDNIDVSQSQKKLPAKKIGYAALLLLLLIAFTYVLSGIIRKTRYRKMNDNEKVIYILQMVIMFLSFIGLQTMEGETLQEFFHRNTDNNLNNRLNQILCIYQEVRYKQIPPTAEQLVLMREAGNDIYFMIFKKIKKRAIILRFTVYDFSFSKKHRRIL